MMPQWGWASGALQASSLWSRTTISGLRQAIGEVPPQASCQRCHVHFRRNALDYAPRKVDNDGLREKPLKLLQRLVADRASSDLCDR